MMNMRKVGIVVQSISLQEKVLTPRQYRAFNMTRYTLCEYQRQAKRNSSRHSFAFYILLIGRIAPVSCRRAAALAAAGGKKQVQQSPGTYVIPGQAATDCHPSKPPQAISLLACSPILPSKQLFHLCSTIPMGLPPVACQKNRRFYE
jgi:hypothetical protein